VGSAQTFPTILADPDWRYQNYGQAMHGAARAHYPGSPLEEIASIPVAKWARRDSILLLWATLPMIDQAIDVMRAWGFELVTALPWVKTIPGQGEIKRGIGFWFQGAAELLLVCRRGKAKAPGKQHERVMGLLWGEVPTEGGGPTFYAPRGPHSRKPLSLVEWIESRLPGPYLELFARGNRPGWTCWGHETGWHLSEAGVEQIEKQVAE